MIKFKASKAASTTGTYATHLKATQVTGTTLVQKTSGKHVIHDGEATEQVHPGLSGSCMVTVQGGRTINLGNYESVKIAVTLSMPANPNDLDAMYEFATDWVGQKLSEAVKVAKP